jgi:RNA polymerase sigma factor (sigma-70 family)
MTDLETLYRDQYVPIKNYLRAKFDTTPPDLIEDAIQNAFVNFMTRRINNLDDGDFEQMRRFLCRVAYNAMLDIIRRERDNTKRPLEDQFGKPLEVHDAASEALLDGIVDADGVRYLRGILKEEIAQLSPQQRRIIALAYGQGLPYPDVAQQLGMSHSAIKSAMFRIYRNLKQRLLQRWEAVERSL